MKIMSLAMAAGLSAVFAVSSIVPAQALQIAPPHVEKQASNDIVQVRHKKWRHGKRWHGHRHWRGRYHHRRHWRGGGYWRGGVWFGAPAVVIKVGPRHRWNRHVRWCRNHYVSYRRADNTWMSNSGVRRVCVSPYRR